METDPKSKLIKAEELKRKLEEEARNNNSGATFEVHVVPAGTKKGEVSVEKTKLNNEIIHYIINEEGGESE